MTSVCRFEFIENTEGKLFEDQLAQAFIVAESIYGRPKVRINAGCYISPQKPQLVIDVSNEIGEYIAQVFTGLITRALGEENFTVERIEGDE